MNAIRNDLSSVPTERREQRAFIALLLAIFLATLLLNILTPLAADDYRYHFSFATLARIASPADVFPSMAEHYRTFNGRVVPHAVTQWMLLLGKGVFNVVNALLYTAFLLMLYRFARGGRRFDPAFLLTLASAAFLLTPAFAQTTLWLDGSCNYLLGVSLMLYVALPFRDQVLREDGRADMESGRADIESAPTKRARRAASPGRAGNPPLSRLRVASLLLAALLMGNCSENSAPAFILLMVWCMLYLRRQKRRVAWWMPACAALALAGWLVMILAPGSAWRNATTLAANLSAAGQYLLNFSRCVDRLWEHALPLLLGYACLLPAAILCGARRERVALSVCLAVCGLAANFAMTAASYYPDRAMMGCVTLLLLSCLTLLPALTKPPARALARALALGLAILSALTFLDVAPDNYHLYRSAKLRESEVLAQRDEGRLDAQTYCILGKSKYDVFYDMNDLAYESDFWVNLYFSKYYGLDSVEVVELR